MVWEVLGRVEGVVYLRGQVAKVAPQSGSWWVSQCGANLW